MGLLKKLAKSILNTKPKRKTYNKNSSEQIGKLGENKVKAQIRPKFLEIGYYIINDYKTMINNKSVQIDHIIITENKVLCIETKNYNNCLILGKYDNYQWTICYGKNKQQMYNPIKQNANHIKVLKQIIKQDIEIENIVVFTGKANTLNIRYKEIYTNEKLKRYVKSIKDNNFSKKAYNIYLDLMESKKDITNEEHINNIKNRKLT